MNEIKNWNEIKKPFRCVNVNFQVQGDNRDAKYFLCNFIIKNMGNVLNFTLKLIQWNLSKADTYGADVFVRFREV